MKSFLKIWKKFRFDWVIEFWNLSCTTECFFYIIKSSPFNHSFHNNVPCTSIQPWIKAWFSVTNTLSDTYGLGKFPFAFMAQFFKSKKILMVNHETLHKIAEKIDKLEGNCVLINNTGRCGSTLLCQVNLFSTSSWDQLTNSLIHHLKIFKDPCFLFCSILYTK